MTITHVFILATCLYVCVGVCVYACVTVCFFTFFILCTVYCVCYLSVNKVFFITGINKIIDAMGPAVTV